MIFSKVGSDFSRDYLDRLCGDDSIECYIDVVDGPTIRFRNMYLHGDVRVQYVDGGGYVISLDESMLGDAGNTDYIIISPVLDEVDPSILSTARRFGRVALDPQGFLRMVGVDGRVKFKPVAEDYLSNLDILKLSSSEFAGLLNFYSLDRLVDILSTNYISCITLGSHGSIIYVDGVFHHIPPYQAPYDVDPTGAGDVYTASLVYSQVYGYSPLESAVFSNVATSYFLRGSRLDHGVVSDKMGILMDGVREIDIDDLGEYLGLRRG